METLVIVAVFAAIALIAWIAYKLKIYARKWVRRCTSCGSLDTKLIKRVIDDDRERVTLTLRCNACASQYEYKTLRNAAGASYF